MPEPIVLNKFQENRFRKLYPILTDREMQKIFSVSTGTVTSIARRLGCIMRTDTVPDIEYQTLVKYLNGNRELVCKLLQEKGYSVKSIARVMKVWPETVYLNLKKGE